MGGQSAEGENDEPTESRGDYPTRRRHFKPQAELVGTLGGFRGAGPG